MQGITLNGFHCSAFQQLQPPGETNDVGGLDRSSDVGGIGGWVSGVGGVDGVVRT